MIVKPSFLIYNITAITSLSHKTVRIKWNNKYKALRTGLEHSKHSGYRVTAFLDNQSGLSGVPHLLLLCGCPQRGGPVYWKNCCPLIRNSQETSLFKSLLCVCVSAWSSKSSLLFASIEPEHVTQSLYYYQEGKGSKVCYWFHWLVLMSKRNLPTVQLWQWQKEKRRLISKKCR